MIETRHTDEEKNNCVNEYLNGMDKCYLSSKYSTSIRTIDRWIKKINVDEVKLKIAKRSGTIPKDIQEEILKILNTNPIFQGFNIAEWNEPKVIKYINNTFGIEINRRMAKALIEDAVKVNTIQYEDRVDSYIEQFDTLGYSIVLLDYIKIGKISRIEIESLELRKYTKNKLDVNLVIARANDHIYLDVIVSEINIVDKSKIEIIKTSEKERLDRQVLQRKVIVDDKYDILNKIKRLEGNENIVFITTYDKDIDKLIRKRNKIKYYIVNEGIYNKLLQEKYEGMHGKSVVDYMNNENNKSRRYESVRDISEVVWGKVNDYVLKITKYRIDIEENAKNTENKTYKMKNDEEKMRKRMVILNHNFIYNI
ncbi:hypothetical protein [Clostridium sp. CF012]|uniref:hypothetical protein n=1 Tax=Clostridium sp. CF012 TaxID=2843319 RepID=UPI00209A75E1|nr:hypothetical protein [Clostridium sp. CF012]